MSTNVRFYLSYDIKVILKSHSFGFCHNFSVSLKASFHSVTRKSSGLSILIHGFISLPDATSYDKYS